MTKTAVSVWDECLSFIKDNIKPQAYKTWFEPIKPVKLSGEALILTGLSEDCVKPRANKSRYLIMYFN